MYSSKEISTHQIAVNLVPDKLIGFIVENGAQERLDTVVVVEAKVIGNDSKAKPQ